MGLRRRNGTIISLALWPEVCPGATDVETLERKIGEGEREGDKRRKQDK